jgi:hypothetical protein
MRPVELQSTAVGSGLPDQRAAKDASRFKQPADEDCADCKNRRFDYR